MIPEPQAPVVDVAAAERAVADLLAALGQDTGSESLRGTPRRVAAAYAELLEPKGFDLTTFPNDEGYDELVVVRDIPFSSLCEHHLLPFVGRRARRLPAGRPRSSGCPSWPGSSSCYARRLQVQERLTVQVAAWLQEHLSPRGVGVVVEAEHMCMTIRGVRAPGARTVTSTLHGRLRDDPRTRAEFLALAGR